MLNLIVIIWLFLQEQLCDLLVYPNFNLSLLQFNIRWIVISFSKTQKISPTCVSKFDFFTGLRVAGII